MLHRLAPERWTDNVRGELLTPSKLQAVQSMKTPIPLQKMWGTSSWIELPILW